MASSDGAAAQVTSVKVAVRVRPITRLESDDGACEGVQVQGDTNTIILGSGASEKKFGFDHSFPPNSTTTELYATCVRPLLQRAIEGYHMTIFAYGQTGSGKTFTMMEGHASSAAYMDARASGAPSNEYGVAPQLMRDLFRDLSAAQAAGREAGSSSSARLIAFKVKVSCLEIYNEQVYDLLSEGGASSAKNVVIRDNDAGEQIITGLTEVAVASAPDMSSVLARSMGARSTAATNMNARSSRSHAVFTITLEQTLESGEPPLTLKRRSQIHLVDLAGSERAKKTGAEGDRLREAASINRGLLALGNVINALAAIEDGAAPAAGSAGMHVPYRDSKLTRLLKSSLGGNAYTLMIACCSPADVNLEETLSTLRYASRARCIKNKAAVNVDATTAQLLVLREQVKSLTAALAAATRGGGVLPSASIDAAGRHDTSCTSCGAAVTIACSHSEQGGEAQPASADEPALHAAESHTSAANMAQLMQRLGALDARNRTSQVEAARAAREVNRMTEEYASLAEMLCSAEQQRDANAWKLQQLVSACRIAVERTSANAELGEALSDVRIALEAAEADDAAIGEGGGDDMDISFSDVNLDGLEAPTTSAGAAGPSLQHAASTTAAAPSSSSTAAPDVASSSSHIPVSSSLALRKATLAREFGAISSALREKEALLSAHARNQHMLQAAQRMHEDELTAMKNEVVALRAERARLETLAEAAAAASTPAAVSDVDAEALATLREQMKGKDEQISALVQRIRESSRQLSLKAKSDAQLAALQAEVTAMRDMKLAAQRRMKEETDRSRTREKEAAAALAAANRVATKKEIENAKLAEMNKQQAAVIRRKMEEIAAMQRKQRDATDRGVTRAAAAEDATSRTHVRRTTSAHALVSVGHGADSNASSWEAATESTFATVASARAGVSLAAGKANTFADAIAAAYKSSSTKELLPASVVTHSSAGGDGDDDDDEGEASTAVDGLVALGDCFANAQSGKVPHALRRLLEGDISCRVTLRRARALVAKLTDERRVLMKQIQEESGEEEDARLQDLNTAVDVVNNDLAALNDTILALRTQLETASNGAASHAARSTRARTGHWTSEMTTLSSGKAAVAWLSNTIIALAETCDNSIRALTSAQQMSSVTLARMAGEIASHKDAVRRAEVAAADALRDREEEIYFLTRRVAGSTTLADTGMPSQAEVDAVMQSNSSGEDVSALHRIIHMQRAQLEAASSLMTRAREAEDALQALRGNLDAATSENIALKSAVADAVKRETAVRYAAASLSLASGKGRKGALTAALASVADVAGARDEIADDSDEEAEEDAHDEGAAMEEDAAPVEDDEEEVDDDDEDGDDDDYMGSDDDTAARRKRKAGAARSRRSRDAPARAAARSSAGSGDEAEEDAEGKKQRKKKRMAAPADPATLPTDACTCGNRSKCTKCPCTKAGRKCGDGCGCSSRVCGNRLAAAPPPTLPVDSMDIDPAEAAGIAPAASQHVDTVHAAAGMKRSRPALSSMAPAPLNVPVTTITLTKGVLVTMPSSTTTSVPPRPAIVPPTLEDVSTAKMPGVTPAAPPAAPPARTAASVKSLDRLAMPKSVNVPKQPVSASNALPAAIGRVSLSKTASILSRPTPVALQQRAAVVAAASGGSLRPPPMPSASDGGGNVGSAGIAAAGGRGVTSSISSMTHMR